MRVPSPSPRVSGEVDRGSLCQITCPSLIVSDILVVDRRCYVLSQFVFQLIYLHESVINVIRDISFSIMLRSLK